MTEALGSAGLWPINKYIWRGQATVVDYITNQTIYEL